MVQCKIAGKFSKLPECVIPGKFPFLAREWLSLLLLSALSSLSSLLWSLLFPWIYLQLHTACKADKALGFVAFCERRCHELNFSFS